MYANLVGVLLAAAGSYLVWGLPLHARRLVDDHELEIGAAGTALIVIGVFILLLFHLPLPPGLQ